MEVEMLESFDAALDALPVLAFATNAQGDQLFVNARLRQFVGHSTEELRQGRWADVLHPDDRDTARRAWVNAIRTNTPLQAEYRIRRHDGQFRWLLCRAESVPHEDGLRWYGTFFDLEERHQAEESRAWLAAIVAASDDAIVSKTLDGIIRSWNSGAEHIFGYSAGEAIGQPISLIIPPERRQEEKTILAKLRRGERIENFETVRLTKGGRLIDVSLTVSPVHDTQGRIIGASKVARDVTERNQMRAALAASRAELRLVADHAAVMLAHCDADCRFLFVNRPYTERFGLTPQQVVGQRIADVLGPEVYAKLEPHVARVLRGERVEFEMELPYERTDAKMVQCVYVPDLDDSGRIRGFVAAIMDLSETKRLQQELREEDRRKNEFLAILGHELRNPLAPLRTGLELLQHAGEEPELLDELRPMMLRQLGHLSRLVDDLLNVSRMRRGAIDLHRAPVQLDQVIEAAVELAHPLIEERRHDLVVEQAETPICLEGDHERLTQVVSNLLSNAAKYTNPGGRVRLATEVRDDEAVIRVADNGVGIPAERAEEIFELFTQLPGERDDSAVQGLGIGLALARQLVALHGGSIDVRSEGPGRGSEFVVRLPLEASHDAPVA